MVATIFGSYVPLGVRPYREAFVFALIILFLVFLPDGLRGKFAASDRV